MGVVRDRKDALKTIFRIPICDDFSGVLSYGLMTKDNTKDKTIFRIHPQGYILKVHFF